MNKYKILLLLLFLLFILSRVFILLNPRPCFDEEVCFSASFAKDFIEGLKMPFLQYIPTYYDGSTLIFPIPLVPLFLLFGYSTLVLNLYGLMIYSTIFFVFSYLILKKHFGFKPAFINSILLIFSYFLISCFSISAKGVVMLGSMCTLILIYLFMNIYFDDKDILKSWALFGFLSGLFLWLNYIVAIVLLLFILFFYLADKLFFIRKKFLIFLSSFFLGFLPRIIYNFSKIYTAEYVEMFGGKYIFIFNLDKLIYVKNKLIDLLLYRIPLSFSFKDFYFVKGTFFDYFYYFIFISVFISFIFIYRKYLFKLLLSFIPIKRFNVDKNKNLKIIFLLMYVVIFIVIYIFSPLSVGKFNVDFFVGYRYLLPLHFVMLILVSIFLAGLYQKKGCLFNINKKISIALLLILSLFGILSLSLFVNSNITYYSEYKSLSSSPFCDDYLCYMKGLYYGYTSDNPIEKCQNTTKKSFCFEALGRVFLRKNNYNFSMGKNYCDNIPLDFRNDCNMGLIVEIHEVKKNESIFSYCNFFDEPYKESCYQSLKEDPLEDRKERLILYLGPHKCYELDTIDHTRIFCPSYWR